MITVACVFVRGHVHFTAEYVIKLKSMVGRALPDARFVCLTDQPDYLAGVETIPITPPRGVYAWWAKLELFNPKHEALQSGTILYFDLDVLIVGMLDAIVTHPGEFVIVPDAAPNFVGKGELRTVKRYNSSVMRWEGGKHNDLFTEWSLPVAKRLWGDQDWIGERRDSLTLMPIEWFPRLSAITKIKRMQDVEAIMNDALVVLCKRPKNAEAAKQWSWFAKAWR